MRFKGNSPEVFSLPLSGQIDLNAIGVEAGQNNNSQTGLNDAAVRDLIGKGSGAQNALSEYYGATSSDAVDSWNPSTDGTDVYWMPPTGGGNRQKGPWSNRINDGSSSIATVPNVHTWPLSQVDGQPHAIGSDHPLIGADAWAWAEKCPWIRVKAGSNHQNQITVSAAGPKTSVSFPGDVGLGWKRTGLVMHMQKIKPGSHRFRGHIKVGGMQMGYSENCSSDTVVRLIEWENCTKRLSAEHAYGNGGNKVTTLFSYTGPKFTYDPMYNPTGSGGAWEQNLDKTVTTTYPWLFLEIVHGTETQRSQSFDTDSWSIN